MVPWRSNEQGEVTEDVLEWYERFARKTRGNRCRGNRNKRYTQRSYLELAAVDIFQDLNDSLTEYAALVRVKLGYLFKLLTSSVFEDDQIRKNI